ncbi:hypothetical protein [Actinomadura litoris]|uniref:hypothetical protein n=1 Tax=Actinomadura litoris TaxID=2678616 RepID=UPI001FA6AF1B|nr:hypothetical protein [Actinomadura litoris]
MVPRGPGDFGKAFSALLRAAKTNPDGVRRALPGVVSRSVLYDWKNGDHLPSDTGPLVQVVELCLGRIRAGTALGSVPDDVNGWMELLAEAKSVRDSESAAHQAPPGPAPARISGPSGLEGRSAEQWGPWRLGVHPVIKGGPLPAYTHRAHDHLLYAVLNPRVAANRLVVLRGGSSTGKSRAAYEAVRARLPNARVYYPPTVAALDALLDQGIAARSVLWLNELRHYAEDSGGQAVLARLAGVLPGRDHVLVITSVWPQYWGAYTADPHAGPGVADPVRASRALLTALPELSGMPPRDIDPARGGVIDVPEAFTDDDLKRARRHGNALLDEAMAAAQRAGSAGQLAQYLAGVPALLAHYHGPGADPYGHALITAAMDAVRLGCRRPLSRELLQEAAVGYLADGERAVTDQAWRQAMSRAWDNATAILKGAIRPLEPVPPEDGVGVAGYRLTDYLDQFGRTHRKEQIPPRSFWTAAAHHAHPDDASPLADHAHGYGLLRDCAQLYKNAAAHGSPHDATWLIRHLRDVHPADRRPLRWAAAHALADDPSQAPHEVAGLLTELRKAGEREHAGALAAQAAAHLLPDEVYLDDLLYELWKIAGLDLVTTLLDRIAQHDSSTLISMASVVWDIAPRQLAGDWSPTATREATRFHNEITAALAKRAAALLPLDDPGPVSRLLSDLHSRWRGHEAHLLDRDPAAHVSLNDPEKIVHLLYQLEKLNSTDQISTLLDRDLAAHVSLGDLESSLSLLRWLKRAGAHQQATKLQDRILSLQMPLDDPETVAELLRALPEMGADDHLMALLARDPASSICLDKASGSCLMDLVFGLARTSPQQLAVLLDRNPADCVALDDLKGQGFLLTALDFHLYEASAEQAALLEAQIGVLARRVSANADVLIGRISVNIRCGDPFEFRPLLDIVAPLDFVSLLEEFDRLGREGIADVSEQLGLLLDRIAHTDAGTVAYLLRYFADRNHPLADAMLDRDLAAQVTIPGPRSALRLLQELATLASGEQLSAFASRTAAQIPLDNPPVVIRLMRFLHRSGNGDQATALAERATARVPLTDPGAIAELIDHLAAIGSPKLITVVLDRDPATRLSLDHVIADWSSRSPDDPTNWPLPPPPADIDDFLGSPTPDDPANGPPPRADVDDFLERPDPWGGLDDHFPDVSSGVKQLVRRLAKVGANDQAAALLQRLPAAGRFHTWKDLIVNPERFRFGREHDGTPAAPWDWNDLR